MNFYWRKTINEVISKMKALENETERERGVARRGAARRGAARRGRLGDEAIEYAA